jgi:cobalt transporter subunit CbtB
MPTASFTTSQPIPAAAAPRINVAAQAVVAIVLGMLIVATAGFAQLEVVHNAAHDTRHSNAFPCH